MQDLLHALLKIHFNNVRPEEWTPSFAGASARMDFLLHEHDIVIEVKKSRPSMTAKTVGDELLADIGRYKAHHGTKQLFCFIYDPEELLANPRGLERDLSKTHAELTVTCIIRPL